MTTAILPAGSALALTGDAGSSLVPGTPEFREHVESGAAAVAREFQEATDSIRRHWAAIGEECERINAVFPGESYNRFRVDLSYSGRSFHDHGDRNAADQVIKEIGIEAWRRLIDRLGVKNLMSVKRRGDFERQIEKGDVPEVTEQNIVGVILGMASQAAEFATEAARETLSMLTPTRGTYKTNSGFKVGRRVVLAYKVEENWGGKGFRPFYRAEAELNALDGMFHVLDEKGCIKGRKGPLLAAMEASPDGRGETDYFRFKCFKNYNLHVEFKRLDLVQKLNGLATGEYVLGQDE